MAKYDGIDDLFVIGSEEVGKKAFVRRTYKKEHVNYYIKTRNLRMPTKPVKVWGRSLMIHDTIGYDGTSLLHIIKSKEPCIFLYMYDITLDDSFHHLQELDKVMERLRPKHLRILVGIKTNKHANRQVLHSDAARLARQWGCPFDETSTMHHKDLKGTIQRLLTELVDGEDATTRPERGCGGVLGRVARYLIPGLLKGQKNGDAPDESYFEG